MNSFIDRAIEMVRLYTDEPSISAKYSEAVLITMLQHCWAQVAADLKRVGSAPVVCETTLTIASGTTHYTLPASVGKLIGLYELSTDGLPILDEAPRGLWNIYGWNVRQMHNALVFNPTPDESRDLVARWIPSERVQFHEGTASAATASTISLDTTPSKGTYDKRENAFVGCVLRMLDGNAEGEERIITSTASDVATVKPDWTTTPSTDSYEICPSLDLILDDVVAWRLAARIIAIQGDRSRYETIVREYQSALRAARLEAAYLEMRVGQRCMDDTADNDAF